MSDFNINCDSEDVAKAISDRYLVEEGYNLARTGRMVSRELASDFVASLQLDGFDVYDLREFDGTITAISQDRSIYLYAAFSNATYTDIYVKEGNVGGIVQFFNKHKKFFLEKDPGHVRIDYYFKTMFGSQNRSIMMAKDKIQNTLPELYPDYDVEKLASQYAASRDNILLLVGEPGVGKTQFIRYVMKAGAYDQIVYVKDTAVLESDDFWMEHSESNAQLMVFDDMDDVLTPRNSARKKGESAKEHVARKNNPFMRNVLSFTDGIFEKETKIIITTNQPIAEVDAALVRPGRCFDFLTLRPLSNADARGIWVDVLKNDVGLFDVKFAGVESITQASLMSEHQIAQSEFNDRSYVRRGDRHYTIADKIRENGVKVR